MQTFQKKEKEKEENFIKRIANINLMAIQLGMEVNGN